MVCSFRFFFLPEDWDLSDWILKHFLVLPYHPASPLPFGPLPFGPLPCGPLSPAVQQGGRPVQPVSFWHGAFPSPPALPGALLSLRISAHRLTAGYLLWPACGCPAGGGIEGFMLTNLWLPFLFPFRFPEGVREGEPDRSCWGASFVGGASSC